VARAAPKQLLDDRPLVDVGRRGGFLALRRQAEQRDAVAAVQDVPREAGP
jgi:hypothetical protein